MTRLTRDDLALYAMGHYDGDAAELERLLADDPEAREQLADEAGLELLLREAASAATFCPACHDLVRDGRCGECGVAVRPGGYVVERVLVANAHGRMYLARDADGKQVALKELAFVQPPGADALGAFEREARFLRALDHSAIPRFCAAFEEGSGVHTRYYLAQEYIAGEPLDARLDRHFFTETEIVELARQVLEILVYLQRLSPMIIHRDIKPANLLVRADGTIALVDFGAAHVQGSTAGSTSIGTFGYMPIEQLAGQVDATTDPYALGASLLHLLTRREPWRILHPSAFESINVSAPLRRFLETLVAPAPGDRFPSAAVALAALERLGSNAGRRPAKPPRRPVMFAALAALTLAGAGAVGFAMFAWRDERPQQIAVPSEVPEADDAVDPMHSSSIRGVAPVEPPPPAAAAAKPARTVVELHVVTVPAGVVAFLDDRFIGVTPLDTSVQRRKTPATLSLQHIRYDKVQKPIALTNDLRVSVSMTPNGAPSAHDGKFTDEQCVNCHQPWPHM